jgi:hypothetical protein
MIIGREGWKEGKYVSRDSWIERVYYVEVLIGGVTVCGDVSL